MIEVGGKCLFMRGKNNKKGDSFQQKTLFILKIIANWLDRFTE